MVHTVLDDILGIEVGAGRVVPILIDRKLLRDLQQQTGTSILLITHDLGVVAGRTDEIAVMYAGRIVEKAPTSVLFRDMKMPYTEARLSSIPEDDGSARSRRDLFRVPR